MPKPKHAAKINYKNSVTNKTAKPITHRSDTSVETLVAARKALLCRYIFIEAARHITLSDTLTTPRVVHAWHKLISTRSPTTTGVTESWTTRCHTQT